MQPFVFSAKPRPFSPASFEGVVLLIPQPSLMEQEDIGIELFRHNITPITDESFRAQLIREIFNVVDDDAQAEEYANMVEEMWLADQVHGDAVNIWQAQEDQRLLDIKNGMPEADLPQDPLPAHTMGRKRRSQALIFMDEMREKSQRVRDLTVEKMSYAKRQLRGTARIMIQDWDGVKAQCERKDGIVTAESYQALMQEIGRQAVAEIEQHCIELTVVSGRERGNSDSPLDTESDLNGSPKQIEGSDSSGGNSTTSPTGPTPDSTSEKTTDESSASTSASDGATSQPVDTPAEATSPNQSG